MPDRLGRVERCLPLFVILKRDVRRRRRETVSSEDGLHVSGSMIEVACELDLLVPDLRDVCERPFEICFHLIAYGVELNADFIEPSGAWCAGASGTRDRESSARHRLNEFTAFHPASSRLQLVSFHGVHRI